MSGFLGRFLPLFGGRSRRLRKESRSAFRRRAEHAEDAAARRKRGYERRTRRRSGAAPAAPVSLPPDDHLEFHGPSFDFGEDVTPFESPVSAASADLPPAAADAPAPAVLAESAIVVTEPPLPAAEPSAPAPSLAVAPPAPVPAGELRKHGIWDMLGDAAEYFAPSKERKPRWFVRWLKVPAAEHADATHAASVHDHAPETPQVVIKEVAEKPLPAPVPAATDLDSLLTGSKPAAEAPVAPEKNSAPVVRDGVEAKVVEIVEKVKDEPVESREKLFDKPAAGAKATASADLLMPELAPHAGPAKEEKKEEPKPEPAKAEKPTVDPEVKTVVVRKRVGGGFADFLGALRSIGLGSQKTAFVANLATMLDAGLPLVDSLKTLKADTRSGAMRALVQRIVDHVENGSPLWRAMESQHCFSPDALALIRIGEEAGSLAENMQYLSVQQEKDHALKSKVKMAMIYPTIVLVLMFIVIIGMGMFVLPSLISVLYSLNVELPLVTRMVIAFTEFFTTHGKVAVPGSVAALLLLFIVGKFTPLRVVVQWAMFKVPGIGRLAREATIARFGVILGGLLRAGVPLVEALKSLVEVTPLAGYRRFYKRVLEHVTVGDSFGKSFAAIRKSEVYLPVSVQQLVTTGERSGSLAKILLKIADIYEKKANDTAQKLPVILEPMLLLFIGSLVGTIAFAIIIPIYSIVGNVGGQ